MSKCERSQLLVRPFITWVLFEILDCIAKLYCNDYHFAWVIANTIRIDWMQCIAQINRIFAKKNIDFIWLMENLWNLLNRIWASSIHFGLLLVLLIGALQGLDTLYECRALGVIVCVDIEKHWCDLYARSVGCKVTTRPIKMYSKRSIAWSSARALWTTEAKNVYSKREMETNERR